MLKTVFEAHPINFLLNLLRQTITVSILQNLRQLRAGKDAAVGELYELRK